MEDDGGFYPLLFCGMMMQDSSSSFFSNCVQRLFMQNGLRTPEKKASPIPVEPGSARPMLLWESQSLACERGPRIFSSPCPLASPMAMGRSIGQVNHVVVPAQVQKTPYRHHSKCSSIQLPQYIVFPHHHPLLIQFRYAVSL